MEILGKPADQLLPSDREQIGVVLADSGFSRYLRIKDLLPVLDHLYHGFSQGGIQAELQKIVSAYG